MQPSVVGPSAPMSEGPSTPQVSHPPHPVVGGQDITPDNPPFTTSSGDEPMPVVKVLSVRGVEYAMMTLSLWFAAVTLAWVLLNVLNGSSSFDYLIVPTSVLITALPVFAFFFIRLKRAELANPALKMEASKRRMSQISQMVAFLASLVNVMVFVYEVLRKLSGNSSTSIGKAVINLLVVLVIAGGILFYYWHDEHRNLKA